MEFCIDKTGMINALKKKKKKNPNPLVNDEEKKKTQPTNQNKSHRRLSFDLQAKA